MGGGACFECVVVDFSLKVHFVSNEWVTHRHHPTTCVGVIRSAPFSAVHMLSPSTKYLINFIALFVLGTINNFTYCVVLACSQDLATHFNHKSFIGFIPWANICMGLAFQILNAVALQGIPHSYRIVFACFMHLLGILGLGLTVWLPEWGFWISLLCIMSIGASATLGEIVILGFLKIYDNDIVSAFSSGTGMAGVAGSFTYLIMGLLIAEGAFGLSLKFFSFVPLVLVYALVWFFMLRPPGPKQMDGESGIHIDGDTKPQLLSPTTDPGSPDSTPTSLAAPVSETDELLPRKKRLDRKIQDTADLLSVADHQFLDPAYDTEEYIIEQVKPHLSTGAMIVDSFATLLRSFRLCWWRSSNLLLVYLFEYIISIGCANAATLKYQNSDNFIERNAFRILGFCYQFGVLISRSSLKVIKIRRVSIITLLQGIMLVVWLVEGKLQYLPVYVLFPIMIAVGLLGGSSYVQIYYLLLSDKKMTPREREYCVNICAIGVTIGITLSSLAIMVLDATLYKDIVG